MLTYALRRLLGIVAGVMVAATGNAWWDTGIALAIASAVGERSISSASKKKAAIAKVELGR